MDGGPRKCLTLYFKSSGERVKYLHKTESKLQINLYVGSLLKLTTKCSLIISFYSVGVVFILKKPMPYYLYLKIVLKLIVGGMNVEIKCFLIILQIYL